ncbi:cytochrome P450 [Vararia minispora EC-137]|uniref:Cytochrome P450 n=1 Tax=Vararia minispora EC-137 TaxID=1314806 RepID=A0ACB8QHM1_9AGAM|nr:cytochrome P450 [Vararia minispora EC-137]
MLSLPLQLSDILDAVHSLQPAAVLDALRSLQPSDIVDAVQQKPGLVLTILAGLSTIGFVRYIRSPYRRLPPGPPRLPLIGNLFQLLEKHVWLKFTEWRNVYGDILYLNVAGQHMIVMNSQKVTTELLERRAAKYSGRARNIVAAEMLTGGLFLAFQSHNDKWRRMRKGAHEVLHKGAVAQYQPIQTLEAILLSIGTLTQPDSWMSHARRAAASTIMSVMYDTPTIADEEDPSVKAINAMVTRLTNAAMPGAYMVEFFPFMKYIPASLAKWKRDALEWYRRDTAVLSRLFGDVRRRMVRGENRPCFANTLITNSDRLKLSPEESVWLLGTLYSAGADTSSGIMTWFMHAMVLNPHIQRKAQEELDAVVGRDRMPTFADRQNLPYIRALVKETLRARTVGPLGMPHYSTEDDWYNGMFIPKGTICIANVWWLNRDPSIWGPDADVFNPERYLKEGYIHAESDPAQEEGHFAFGFGRRICIGRHIANASLFIDMAIMLWAMNIDRAPDAPFVDATGWVDHGVEISPVPFKIKTTPRFPEALAILEEERERWRRS